MKLHHSEAQNLKIPPAPFSKGGVSVGFARAAQAFAPRVDICLIFVICNLKFYQQPAIPRANGNLFWA